MLGASVWLLKDIRRRRARRQANPVEALIIPSNHDIDMAISTLVALGTLRRNNLIAGGHGVVTESYSFGRRNAIGRSNERLLRPNSQPSQPRPRASMRVANNG